MMYLNILKKGIKTSHKACFLVQVIMNKKEAIAYAQIVLNYLKSTACKEETNLENFGLKMEEAFELYPTDLAIIMASKMVEVEKEYRECKNVQH